MKTTLKDAVSKQFDDTQLNDVQLDKLISLQNSANVRSVNEGLPEQEPVTSEYKGMFWRGTLVASMLLIAAAILQGPWFWQKDMSESIAEEVAYNHFKLKPLEVKGDSIHAMLPYFKELGFNPVNSDYMGTKPLNLVGGRYCSIKGVTAAQMRYRNPESGKLETFYEVPYSKNLYGVIPAIEQGGQPIRIQNRGVEIEIWREKGLLMAVTKTE